MLRDLTGRFQRSSASQLHLQKSLKGSIHLKEKNEPFQIMIKSNKQLIQPVSFEDLNEDDEVDDDLI